VGNPSFVPDVGGSEFWGFLAVCFFSSCNFSKLMGEIWPNPECRLRGLYQVSIQVKMASLACTLVSLVLRAMSLHSKVANKLLAMALSYSLLAATAEFWAELERTQPEATERYFLSLERLAAHWRNGFVARLFSKP
jgi:hypothetical protein